MLEGLQSSLPAVPLLGLQHTLRGAGGVGLGPEAGPGRVGSTRKTHQGAVTPSPIGFLREQVWDGGGVAERTEHVSNVLVLYYCFPLCGDKSK